MIAEQTNGRALREAKLKPSSWSRIKEAYARYGARAVSVVFYRALFEWPRLRSKAVQLKIKWLLKSEIAATVSFGKDIGIKIPGGFLAIGEQSVIGTRCFFDGWPNPPAEIRIGAKCYLAHDVYLGAFKSVVIGNNVRIAEFTSLRDSTHNYRDRDLNINEQGDTIGQIVIKDDVWIGRGSLIIGSVEGTVVGRGAVIAAHSVVKQSIPDYAIAGGVPAKIIGYRRSSHQAAFELGQE